VGALQVCRAGEAEQIERWNETLRGSRGALFSRIDWVETVASAVGCSWSLHHCLSADELWGGAVLLERRGSSGKRRSPRSPLPLFSLQYFSSEITSPAKRIPRGVRVLTALQEYLRREYVEPLSLLLPPDLVDLRPLSWSGWTVSPRHGFLLSLPVEEGGARIHIEEDRSRPEGLFTRLATERRYGKVYTVRAGGGLSTRILLLRDESRLYPLLPTGWPERLDPQQRLECALALATVPEAEGRNEILFLGQTWERWFGIGKVAPLEILPYAQAISRRRWSS